MTYYDSYQLSIRVRLMLFSEHRIVYTRHMGNLANDALVEYYPEFSDPSHEAKLMVTYLLDWHCMLENVYCIKSSKFNFDRVKHGEIEWNGIDPNLRLFSLNYGVRPVL